MSVFGKKWGLGQKLEGFKADCRGGIAIMMGISFPVILLGVGGAIDYTSSVNLTQKAQRAMDSTVLSLSRQDLSSINVQVEGRRIFESILVGQGIDMAPTDVQFVSDGTSVRGTGLVSSRTFFLNAIGLDTVQGRVESEAVPAVDQPIEIALVLDVSGSMDWDINGVVGGSPRRIDILKNSVNLMFDTLEDTLPPTINLSASLVPYATSVNLRNVPSSAISAVSVNGLAKPPSFVNIFATERTPLASGPVYSVTDASPIGDPIQFITPGNLIANTPTGPLALPATNPLLQPLSNNIPAIRSAVAGLTPAGATAGHLGMIWGLHTLSEDWASIWPQAPLSSDDANKFVVMLTDGQFNTTMSLGGAVNFTGGLSNIAAYDYFDQSCEVARNNGYTIYLIALGSGAGASQLSNCVGSSGQLFTPATASELDEAFEGIARRIGEHRLTG